MSKLGKFQCPPRHFAPPYVRLAARLRGRRSDRHAGDAADRLPDNQYGHHAVLLRVRSLNRAYASSGFRACSARDLRRSPESHVRRRDPHACGGDGRREHSPHGRP